MLSLNKTGRGKSIRNNPIPETLSSQEAEISIHESGLVSASNPFLLGETTSITPLAKPMTGQVITEKTNDQLGLYYQFAWIPFFPIVLVSSLFLKLKNRHLANEEHYLEHQDEFFSFFKSILEKVGYAHFVRTDKFHKLRAITAEYAFEGHDNSNLHMLDIATGFGFQALALKARGAAVVHGIDVVPERVRGARELHGDQAIRFKVMDAAYMKFPDNSFDSTVVSCALHDMPKRTKERVIREMVRVTKIGGNIVILEPRTFENRLIGLLLGIVGELLDESLNIKDYVMNDLNGLLESFGLQIVKEENLYTAKVLNLKLVRVTGRAKAQLKL